MNLYKKPRGFTLAEALVVASIIALLIALIIPAVQAAREAGRRGACANNLRQIGIGLSAYLSSHNSFPCAQNGDAFSFLGAILPYVEQTALYNSFNLQNGPYSGLPLPTVKRFAIAIYLCPSDGQISSDENLAPTSYAGNRGIGAQKYGENGAFTFPPGTIVKPSDFTDGLSNTAMVSEWLLGSYSLPRDPKRSVFLTPAMLDAADQFSLFVSKCHNINIIQDSFDNSIFKGTNAFHGDFGFSLYNHSLTPNDHSCLNGSAYQIGAWTSASNHSHGVNVLIADMSVHFIRDTSAVAIWQALGSRNGGEVVSPDVF